tara:strand:- start:2224 stop:2982 length:759 start_codon:yes stop_codon:yes gene_type:complete
MSFSIITTVLNGEKFLSDCVNSIQKQKYSKNIEHIIIDGGSKDNTINLIKEFSNNFKNINFFLEKNISIYEGINIGLKIAKNKFIGILNSDDFYNDDKVFENLELVFQNNPDISAIHSNVKIFKRNNLNEIYRIYNSKDFNPEDFFKCDNPPHTSLFLKREIYEKFGNFNESLKIASDFEFMLRVFGKNKIKTKFIDKTFVCMRSHGVSTKNINNIIKSNYEVIKSFKINNLKINYLYLIMKIIKKIRQIKL